MNLHILFGQRRQSYDGEFAPEPLLCWSAYEIDENPEGYDGAVEAAQKKAEKDFSSTQVFIIKVDGEKIAKILNEPVVIKGEIQP